MERVLGGRRALIFATVILCVDDLLTLDAKVLEPIQFQYKCDDRKIYHPFL
jgi:hypothetical protein